MESFQPVGIGFKLVCAAPGVRKTDPLGPPPSTSTRAFTEGPGGPFFGRLGGQSLAIFLLPPPTDIKILLYLSIRRRKWRCNFSEVCPFEKVVFPSHF